MWFDVVRDDTIQDDTKPHDTIRYDTMLWYETAVAPPTVFVVTKIWSLQRNEKSFCIIGIRAAFERQETTNGILVRNAEDPRLKDLWGLWISSDHDYSTAVEHTLCDHEVVGSNPVMCTASFSISIFMVKYPLTSTSWRCHITDYPS